MKRAHLSELGKSHAPLHTAAISLLQLLNPEIQPEDREPRPPFEQEVILTVQQPSTAPSASTATSETTYVTGNEPTLVV